MEQNDPPGIARSAGDQRGSVGQARPCFVDNIGVRLGQQLACDGNVIGWGYALKWAVSGEVQQPFRFFP